MARRHEGTEGTLARDLAHSNNRRGMMLLSSRGLFRMDSGMSSSTALDDVVATDAEAIGDASSEKTFVQSMASGENG